MPRITMILLLSISLIFLACQNKDAEELTGNSGTNPQPAAYYDTLRLEYAHFDTLLDFSQAITPNPEIDPNDAYLLLIGRESNYRFRNTYIWNYYLYNLKKRFIAFDSTKISLNRNTDNWCSIDCYVIDSDSTLQQFKKSIQDKYTLSNGQTALITSSDSYLLNRLPDTLGSRQLITVVALTAKGFKTTNYTASYSPEYLSSISSQDTAVSNAALRLYGDSYLKQVIRGGSVFELRTYYVPPEQKYTVSQVRKVLKEKVTAYFNLRKETVLSEPSGTIFKNIYPSVPSSVIVDGGDGFDLITGNITTHKLQQYVNNLTAGSSQNLARIGYVFASYNPTLK